MINNQRFIGGCNSLNTIRLLAAFEVLYGHTMRHIDIHGVPGWLDTIIHFFHGVPIFFTMSGFLIWMSIGRSSSFGQYCKKRFWRIFPELWVAVAIEIIVLLLLYDHTIEWGKLGLFAFTQGTVFQFWTPDFLRGYGCGTPNGSLWTICVLIQFYIVAYWTYKWLNGKNWKVWLFALILSVGLSALTPVIRNNVPEIVGKLYGQTFIPYFWMFIAGAMVSEFKSTLLPLFKKYWWIAFAISIAIMATGFDYPLGHYGLLRTLSLLVCLIGFAYAVPQVNIKTDISYAVYIYHMTVVNAMINLGYMHKPLYLLVVSIITFAVSYLSTKWVGKWSQMMKRKIQ